MRLLPLHLMLCLFLVFAQSAALVHSHDGDLQKQFDCDICLKLNSSDTALGSSTATLAVVTASPVVALPQFSFTSLELTVFHARAPPALI